MDPPETHLKQLSRQGVKITLKLQGIPEGNYKMIHYRFDDSTSHAYKSWLQMGSPEDPTPAQYNELAASMEPEIAEMTDLQIRDGEHTLDLDFPSSGVSFVRLSGKGEKPSRVSGLSHKRYRGLNGEDMVMLLWDHAPDSGIRSYEVFVKGPGENSFRKANQADLLSAGYAHATGDASGYEYKVRVVDYWDREGAFSEVIRVEDHTIH